jgi:hypothetical protein
MPRVEPRQQRGPGGRTHRSPAVRLRKARPFSRHAVDARGLNQLLPVHAHIPCARSSERMKITLGLRPTAPDAFGFRSGKKRSHRNSSGFNFITFRGETTNVPVLSTITPQTEKCCESPPQQAWQAIRAPQSPPRGTPGTARQLRPFHNHFQLPGAYVCGWPVEAAATASGSATVAVSVSVHLAQSQHRSESRFTYRTIFGFTGAPLSPERDQAALRPAADGAGHIEAGTSFGGPGRSPTGVGDPVVVFQIHDLRGEFIGQFRTNDLAPFVPVARQITGGDRQLSHDWNEVF